ncbi:MAG: hypothetical protein AAF602_18690, partial [Myxococcota bacterium]
MMSNERYESPRLPPGPPLEGLLDGQDPRVSFMSADRHERTDPYGLENPTRPAWLEGTPGPAARRAAAQRELGSMP